MRQYGFPMGNLRTPPRGWAHALRWSSLLLFVALAACDDGDPEPGGEAGAAGVAGSGGGLSAEVTPEVLLARGACPAVPAGEGTKHSGTIAADETWTAAGNPHRVTFSLSIQATVTIDPCVVVELDDRISIEVGTNTTPGKLVARGAADTTDGVRPIVFRPLDPARPWSRLQVSEKGSLDLAVAAVVGGGAYDAQTAGSLVLRGPWGGTNAGEPVTLGSLDRVLVEKSASYGLRLEGWGVPTRDSSTVWVRNSGSEDEPYAVRIEPGVAGYLPQKLVATGNRKDAILMMTPKNFTRTDTLVDRGLPYHQRGLLYLAPPEDGAATTLTVEPGVTLAFVGGTGAGIRVGSTEKRTGALVAEGRADAPIVFTSAGNPEAGDVKSPGDWGALIFFHFASSSSRIAQARVEYAGGDTQTVGYGCGPKDNDAAVIIHGQGEDDAPPGEAFITGTTFDQIGGGTVIVSGWADDEGPNFSEGNTFGGTTPACKVSQPHWRNEDKTACEGREGCWGG